MPNIKLESSDKEIFEVDLAIARRSEMINTMCIVTGDSEEEENTPVPLPNVNSEVLKKIIEWLIHHKDDPPTPQEDVEDNDKRMQELVISNWDREFLDVEQPLLFGIILAANFLDIKELLDVSCKTVGNMIRGKTAEEIRAIFHIENDFGPGEEDEIRKHNEWCEST